MPTVAFDARDAHQAPLRGWGRYARDLLAALRDTAPPDIELRAVERGGRGPEVLFEQVGLPLLLRREGADAVHVPNCFLPLRRPCPGVVTILDLAFEEHPEDFAPRTRHKYRALAPLAARSAERVICISRSTRDDVCDRYGVSPGKVRVIPLAPSLVHGEAEPPPGPYLLAVGDLRKKKNLLRLVQAYALLRRNGLQHHLVLAGLDTGEGERLRRAAGDAPLEITGYATDARLDALLRGADLLVHPSLYEGFGLVLLEAMARGCPVAAARATALPETGADAALYFDPLDRDSIAGAIEHAISDRQLHARLVAAGRLRAAKFSWRATAKSTLAVYAELVG